MFQNLQKHIYNCLEKLINSSLLSLIQQKEGDLLYNSNDMSLSGVIAGLSIQVLIIGL